MNKSYVEYPAGTSAANAVAGAKLSVPMRDRDPNCIDNVLKEIEVNLSESVNSAENLADKLRGEEKCPAPGADSLAGDISTRLQQILNMVLTTNQHLGRAHSAISG